MKNTLWRLLIIFSFITGIGLSACTTSEPVANENSEAFQPMKVAAEDCDYGGEILSVESLDAYSVKFTLCKPDSVFPAKMAAPIFAVQDQDYLNQNAGDSLAMSDTPNGTGAFRLKEWKRAEGMLLEPSSSYWGVPALPATIDFQWRFDAAKRFSFTTMASVDGFDRPPSGMIQYVRPNPELVLLSHEPMNTYYIGMNNTISPFDKPEFRIALAMAIDPSVAVRVAFPEGSEIAQQLVPSNLNPGYSPLIKWYEARPRDATNLLRDADYDFNQELTLAIPNVSMQYLETPSVVANNIIRQLADINVKVTLKINGSP